MNLRHRILLWGGILLWEGMLLWARDGTYWLRVAGLGTRDTIFRLGLKAVKRVK
jgi:hypothetical protein